MIAAPGTLKARDTGWMALACTGCGVTLARKVLIAGHPVLCTLCRQRRDMGLPPPPGKAAAGQRCAVCGREGERLQRERATGILRCAVCQGQHERERHRRSRQRWTDARLQQNGYAARARAAAAGEWLPVPALQRAIAEAQAQRAARAAFLALRRQAGVPSPEEAVLHVMRRRLVAAVFAIPERAALADG